MWLTMPSRFIRAFARQMRSLQAAESLRRITEIAAGTATMDKDARRQLMNSLERDATTERRQPSQAELIERMKAIGVPVRGVKRG